MISQDVMPSMEYTTSKYVNTEHLSKLTYKSFWNTQQALVHGQVYYGYQGVMLCLGVIKLDRSDVESNRYIFYK